MKFDSRRVIGSRQVLNRTVAILRSAFDRVIAVHRRGFGIAYIDYRFLPIIEGRRFFSRFLQRLSVGWIRTVLTFVSLQKSCQVEHRGLGSQFRNDLALVNISRYP